MNKITLKVENYGPNGTRVLWFTNFPDNSMALKLAIAKCKEIFAHTYEHWEFETVDDFVPETAFAVYNYENC